MASPRREFARLVAEGVRLDIAARKAGLDPWRALRMVDEPEMLDLLAAVKPGHWTTLREELHGIREREAASPPVAEETGRGSPIRGTRASTYTEAGERLDWWLERSERAPDV